MATTHTDTNINQLIINKLTKQEYDKLQQVSDTELYLVEEQVDSVVTQNSTNPVQSGAVYEALQDIGGNINDGITTFTKNNQTIGTTSANQENDKTIAIPNDVEMVYFAHSKALSVQTTDAYYDTNYNYLVEEDPETWTDPNPQHRITTDGYYYDLSTGNIYQVNNYETTEVTSNVTIQGNTHKLYVDITTNKAYRWNGSNFVPLVDNNTTYTLSNTNEKVVLTPSQGTATEVSLNTLINGLSTGNSDPQDDDYIVAQYAGGGTTTTTYHRRPLSKFWNWIKSKLGIGTNNGTFLRKDGTWATPTDTKATVTTTGSGNAITSLTASNGALTATKGSTFLTSHQDISGKVSKSGDSMSGTLTFTTANSINYNANNGNVSMIRFKTGDANGHGIVIGGGGLTVIGAGESATTVAAQSNSGGLETMQVCSDENIEFYTNCQSGFSSAKKSYLDTSGNMYVNGSQVRTGTVAIANGGTGATTRLGALQNLTSETVGTSAQYFLTITTNWGKGGYTSVADAKTVLGLGSAAYVNADTAASNNTVVKRTSNGYINATYFNQSSSAETPTSSSYIMYCNSDGYLRKSSIANIKSLVDTNTWRPLGTGATDACAGNDSRLSNSRPASDVYAWAKASTKPSYTASEVGAVSTAIKTFSGTGYTAIQIGPDSSGIVIISFAYKPTSTTVSLPVTGSYKALVYFLAGNRSTSASECTAVFKLTAAGYIQNESTISTNVTYYGTLISIRIS